MEFQKIALLGEKPNASNSEKESNILARTSRGHVLCAESVVGKGKVVIWASTVDPDWGNWPQGRLFVPLVRQWMSYLTDHHERQSSITHVVASAKPGVTIEGDRVVVSNVDPQESELARVTSAEFRDALQLPDKEEFADLSPEELASLAPPPGSERPEEIWRWVAWLLLGWLILETFLAGRVHA